jgi:hypothetical protein
VRVDWRIIGSDVIDAGAGGSWQTRFEDIGIQVESPVYSSRDLNKAFAWADVVVLPSRWEGAPLTILEAQRLGCVPIATAVGAVGELIEHGVDGLLIRATDDGAVTRELAAAIERLAGDPAELRRMAETAAERNATRGWDQTVEPLMRQLAAWFPDRLSWGLEDGGSIAGSASSADVNNPVLPDRAAREEPRKPSAETLHRRSLRVAAVGSPSVTNELRGE